MEKKKRKKTMLALALSAVMATMSGIASVSALNAQDVLNDDLDDLQQTIVDYIFIKNYVSGNISLSEEFKKHLDYNKDNVITIMDANHAKNKILNLSGTSQPSTTTTVTTAATLPSPVTTTPAVTTKSGSAVLKIGDMVTYKGKAYAKADGTGNSVEIDGKFEITNILTGTNYKYTVQLKNIGWVAYEDVAGTKQPAQTQATTTTAGSLKIGDVVHYSGKAYAKADGTGNSVSINGNYEITNILTGTDYKYTVQLKNIGWVAYEDVAGAKQPAQTQVADGNIKIGDVVQFTGKAYYTASGSGTPVDVLGKYEIINILNADSYKYTVQLKNVGWVSYEELTGHKQPSASVTTVPVTTTTKATTVTTAAPAGTLKIGDTVTYNGKAYYSSSGSGTSVDINGTFKVKTILTEGNYPYTVQLENAGWVSYEKLTGKKQPVSTVTTATVTTKAPAVTAAAPVVLKVGDTVNYSGKAYYSASGNGTSVDVNGSFKIKTILTEGNYPYKVQLENAGWVSYEKVVSQRQAAVTTVPVTTKATTTAAPAGDLKEGDTVKYSGKAYYSASGNGTSVDVNGSFKVKTILAAGSYQYTVQLENAGWVSYEKLTGKKQPSTAVTTVTTKATTATTTAPATALKEGDTVKYSGKAYYSASGNGTSVDVNGSFKVKTILTEGNYPYKVQLENAGWVSYDKVVSQRQSAVTTTPAVTTAPPVTTTAPAVTTPAPAATGNYKVGDTVKYKGKVQYSASGNGKSADVDGTFKIAEILTGTSYAYPIRLDSQGWVSYKDITGSVQSSQLAATNFDGNTYRIKNVASGKYITVDGVDNRCNIYQSDAGISNTQMFKFSKLSYSENYRLFSINATNRVMDIVKGSSSTISSGCNIQLYEAVDPEAQTWTIQDTGNGKFKIVSSKNTSQAMTVYGTGNGTGSAKTSTSEGNIFVSEYKGTDSQLWYLEKVN